VLKNSDITQFQGKDFEAIITNVVNHNLEGLHDEVSTGFNDIIQRMDTMLKRQDEVIVERDHKVIELEEEIKRLKSLKWYQRK
jgi:archaellum component FlaC